MKLIIVDSKGNNIFKDKEFSNSQDALDFLNNECDVEILKILDMHATAEVTMYKIVDIKFASLKDAKGETMTFPNFYKALDYIESNYNEDERKYLEPRKVIK